MTKEKMDLVRVAGLATRGVVMFLIGLYGLTKFIIEPQYWAKYLNAIIFGGVSDLSILISVCISWLLILVFLFMFMKGGKMVYRAANAELVGTKRKSHRQ